jgi:hypothetical protein
MFRFSKQSSFELLPQNAGDSIRLEMRLCMSREVDSGSSIGEWPAQNGLNSFPATVCTNRWP